MIHYFVSNKARRIWLVLAWITTVIFLQASGVKKSTGFNVGGAAIGGRRYRRGSADAVGGGSFMYAEINSNVTLPCRVPLSMNKSIDDSSASSAPSQQQRQRWYKDGLPLETLMGVLTAFSRDDVGNYSCMVTDSFGSMLSEVTKLRVAESAPIIFEKTSYVISPGDSLRLACPVMGWTPLPTHISWHRGDIGSVSPLDHLVLRDGVLPSGVLHLTNLTRNDTGVYHCSAHTGDETRAVVSRNFISVYVNATDERTYKILQKPPTYVESVAGETVFLECFINSVNGETAIWEKRDKSTPDRPWRRVRGSSQLSIEPNQYMRRRSTRLDMGGDYRCNVLSAQDDTLASFPTTISVRSPPYFVPEDAKSDPEIKTCNGGITVNLSCDVQGDSQATRVWLKDGVPVPNCFNNRITDGLLKLEHVSKNESGYYQCIAINKYGTATYSYKVIIRNSAATTVITSALFTKPEFARISWKTTNHDPIYSVMAYNIIFSQDVCDSRILIVGELLDLTAANCEKCGDADCCEAEIEVVEQASTDYKASTDYRFQVVAFTGIGGLPSDPVTAVAFVNKTEDEGTYEPLGVTAQDFGSVIIIRWALMSGSSGYHVTTQYQTADGRIKSDTEERSGDQDYAVLPGKISNTTLHIEVKAIHEPIVYKERTTLNITRPFAHKRRDLRVVSAPNITIISIKDGVDERPGIFAYWTGGLPTSNFSYIWYKCDGRENFLQTSTKSLTINNVDRRCYLVVAPVLLDSPLVAAVASYERWCREIAAPKNVAVTPHHETDVDGTAEPDLYAVLVEWSVDSQANKTCEVNYMVRWKLRDSPMFPEANSQTVQARSRAIIKKLSADYTYEFQVVTFTNVSDETESSAVISYTVGPPLNAKNLAVKYRSFPRSTVVMWSRAESGHDITLYVIMLYVKAGGSGSRWRSVNTTTIKVVPGVSLRVDYPSLEFDTTYNVTISSVNLQGAGGVSSLKFSTPFLPTVPASPETTTADGGTSSMAEVFSLTSTEVAIIIAVSISIIIIFLSVLFCAVLYRRFKHQERRRLQNRFPQSTRLHTFTNHQPLIVNTSPPPQYEMSVSTGSHTMSSRLLVNDERSEPSLPSLQALGSPLQRSVKATSGKDSGIYGGGADDDDHRSSQDLGEYDVETDELRNSNLSLSLTLSNTSSQSNSGIQWSCEDYCTRRDSGEPSQSPRTHTESESDSLLTDAHRPTPSSKKQSHLKCRPKSADFHTSERPRATDYFTLDSKPPDEEERSCRLSPPAPSLTTGDSKTASCRLSPPAPSLTSGDSKTAS